MKPKIMISFQEGGENGGPYISHKRIMESYLQNQYDFYKIIIPKGRIGVFNSRLYKNLRNQIKEINPDVVHIHGLQLAGYHLLRAAKSLNIPIVLAVHGSSSESLELNWIKKIILNFLEKYTLMHADIVYGVSDYVGKLPLVYKNSKQYFGTIYNLGNNITVQPYSIRKELNISQEDIILVSTGRITKEKGYDFLCKALIELKLPNCVKTIIIGNGEYLQEFKNKIDEEKIKGIFFLGYRENVTAIIKECNIFTICTRHETLSISILEAQFAGLPIIAPNVGGIPEIVVNGYNGLLYEIDDLNDYKYCINKLIGESKTCIEMGNNGINIVMKKFNELNILNKISSLYEGIINEQNISKS